MSTGSIAGILRSIFFWIDSAVYGFINQLYWLFSMLSEASIFTQKQINDFAERIYVLISIIMLFKLGFSFITYIVNPDSLTDKQKGGTALIKKIVISIALLVSVPTIFNEAYYLQNIIFENNVIDKILLGDTYTQNKNNENFDRSKALSTYAFFTFFKPATFMEECQNYEGISISAPCIERLNIEDDTGHNPGSAYKEAIENYSIDILKQAEVVSTVGTFVSKNQNFYMADSVYLFDYNYPISTLVGVFIAWMLLGFCLDLAVRAVKLGFLQIIAPIPIILSLSPQQKNNTLANWGKECLSTWASLFIRVLVISFALSLIVTINNGGIFSFVTGGTNQFSMVTVFVMLGILLFAKEFPKLLEDILGIKGAGKMTFNAWKKLGSVPLVGGLAAAGMTAAGGIGLAAGRGIFGLGKSLALGANSARKGEGFGAGFKSGFDDTKARIGNRMHAMGTSAKEKITSAGLTGTDKLGGSMHKAYQEGIKDYNKARKEMKEDAKNVEKGLEPAARIKAGEDAIMNKLRSSGSISSDEVKAVTDLYQHEYKNKQYGALQAQLSMAKNKGVYEKQQLSIAQAEMEGAKTAEERATIATKINAIQKNISDSDDAVKNITTQIERIEKTDKASATKTAQIKAAKSTPSAYISKYTDSSSSVANNNQQTVGGVSVQRTADNELRTPSGIILPGSTPTTPARSTSTTSGTPANNSSNNRRPSGSSTPGINSGFNSNNQ